MSLSLSLRTGTITYKRFPGQTRVLLPAGRKLWVRKEKSLQVDKDSTHNCVNQLSLPYCLHMKIYDIHGVKNLTSLRQANGKKETREMRT